jgi:uncharacterized protein (TIGR03083 family)
MDVGEHIEALQGQGELLVDAAGRAGLAAKVPSCPGWEVRDLLRHQGYVHRWATRYVAERLPEWVPRLTEPEILASEPPDAGLLSWFRDGHAALVQALRSADPALSCFSFLPAPSPRAFWARRQAHETTIHRVDAELADGKVTVIGADLAADGIDELIMGFFGRDADRLSEQQRAADRLSVAVRAADAGAEWRVELTKDGQCAAQVQRVNGSAGGRSAVFARGPQSTQGTPRTPTTVPPAMCTLAGPASGLYRLLWNRADPESSGVQVTGDPAVLAAWREGMRVTWA